jgi:hypothetical protein
VGRNKRDKKISSTDSYKMETMLDEHEEKEDTF